MFLKRRNTLPGIMLSTTAISAPMIEVFWFTPTRVISSRPMIAPRQDASMVITIITGSNAFTWSDAFSVRASTCLPASRVTMTGSFAAVAFLFSFELIISLRSFFFSVFYIPSNSHATRNKSDLGSRMFLSICACSRSRIAPEKPRQSMMTRSASSTALMRLARSSGNGPS